MPFGVLRHKHSAGVPSRGHQFATDQNHSMPFKSDVSKSLASFMYQGQTLNFSFLMSISVT